ncbi:MAG: hypothetical protein OXD01_09895 [Gammaproteobacteria bacterium]|nr:hypothetical protein [Gammaproteobacteria bacterium]
MTWQVLLASATAIPAQLIASTLVAAIIYQRHRVYRFHRQQYLTGPRYIRHSQCRCHLCQYGAQQREWFD